MQKVRIVGENHNKLVESFYEYHAIMKVLSEEKEIDEDKKITKLEYEQMLIALMKSIKSIRRWSNALYESIEIVDELNFKPYFVKTDKVLEHDVDND